MDIPEFITAWLNHSINQDTPIFGIPAYWWLRCAKIVQLLSASVIVVDIIGLRKLQNVGKAMDDLVPWPSILKIPAFINSSLSILGEFFAKTNRPSRPAQYAYESLGEGMYGRPAGSVKVPNPNYTDELKSWETYKTSEAIERPPIEPRFGFFGKILLIISFFMGLVVCVASGFLFYRYVFKASGGASGLWIIWLACQIPILFITAYLVHIIVACIVRLPQALLVGLFLDPIGKLLSTKRLKYYALTTSFIFLIMGFLVDFALS